jgi:predicted porin
LLGFGGFTLGAGYNRSDAFFESAQADIVTVGLKYGFGAANVSVGYAYNKYEDDDLDDASLFVVSGDVGILPGVTLKGDVSYNNNDLPEPARAARPSVRRARWRRSATIRTIRSAGSSAFS